MKISSSRLSEGKSVREQFERYFAERNTLGKKQSLDFGIKMYEAGIRDAEQGKTSASR